MSQIENTTENASEHQNSGHTDKHQTQDNSDSQYMLPVDENEDGRLKRLLNAYTTLYGGAYQAPIKNQLEKGIKVLDNACGKGAHWAINQAKKFPNSEFIGVDLSDVFPSKDKRPDNIDFVLGDASKKIPASDNTFDFAYQKLVELAFTNEDWINNIKELYRVIKPGGYVELSEFYCTSPSNPGPLMDKIMHALNTSIKSKNIIADTAPIELEERLGAAGFINQTSIARTMPLNHGEHGKLYWGVVTESFLTLRPMFAEVYPEWEDIKLYEKYLGSIKEECAKYKTSFEWQVCYAQK